MKIFGVVNASPDSLATFSIVDNATSARKRGEDLIATGATHLDIGAEGSSEFAESVTPIQEWERLVEPLEGLLSLEVDVAIDTRHALVAKQALEQGATVLNAGEALQSSEMLEVAADYDALIVLPFIVGSDFRNMQKVVGDPAQAMINWFEEQINRLQKWGLVDRLLLDPGVGFAPAQWDWSDRYEFQKSVYSALPRLRQFNLPLYVPVAWKQESDRLELMDIALSSEPEYVRAHIPSQVLARKAALDAGKPLPYDQLTDASV